MKPWKKKLTGFMIALCALCITVGAGSVQNVQAASKAMYTIRNMQEKKTYKSSSATYSYQLPQLKGSSAAVKKINKSLKADYNKKQQLKKDLFQQFNTYKKKGTLNKRSLKLFANMKCTVDYNKDGYIRFAYRFAWHGCSSYDATKTTVIYRLKDGKKVSKIPISAADKSALNLIKGTWYSPDGDRVVFSGKKANYYFSSDSTEPDWTFDIDAITKTDYGYYFKIDMGQNIYFGYRLSKNDTSSLTYIGKGKPYSTAGYVKSSSLSRTKQENSL